MIKFILLLLAVFSGLPNLFAAASLSDRQQVTIAQKYRRSMHLDDVANKILKGEIAARRLEIIRAVLYSTVEKHIHQQRGATKNRVWVHQNGHYELVLLPNGDKYSYVKDGINDGSYNYFHPIKDAIRHYFYDIHPWILMGHTRKDPTTPKERLSAYMLDLEDGLILASKSKPFPSVDVRSLRPGEAEAYAIFLTAFEKGEGNDVYTLVENEEILDPSARASILSKVAAGFSELYAK